MEVAIASLTTDQELAREVLLRTFPGANAVDDDTLDAIVRQEPVDLPRRESSAALDLYELVLVRENLPIATGLLTIIPHSVLDEYIKLLCDSHGQPPRFPY
jgi:hypothetical protein